MKKSTLLAGLIVCIALLSCKKESSSSSNSQTTVKYEIVTTNHNEIAGDYYTAAGYDLGFLVPNIKDWTMTVAVNKPFSAHLEYLGGGDTTTLTISVNNNVAKTQTFFNTQYGVNNNIYYTVN